jgi:FMN phosphatase YigB (HAD superfamily)
MTQGERPFPEPYGRPRAIVLDAFGTIVGIGARRRPYHRFTSMARSAGGAVDPLVADLPLRDWAASVGAPPGEIAMAEADLAIETGSIRLRDWVPPAWHAIREAGIRIGVCSNLATPYGPPLLSVLPDDPDVVVLSYAVGLKKPDPAIYALVADRLGIPPAGILFVGDTRSADHDGPRAAGMSALPVEAFETAWPDIVADRPWSRANGHG